MRYSLHSTNSLADVASKSSIASFNEVQNNEDATATPDQVLLNLVESKKDADKNNSKNTCRVVGLANKLCHCKYGLQPT